MFTETLLQRNPALVEWSLYAHRSGLILPNTYVLDLDAIRQNASAIKQEAQRENLNLYMMTKQFGRNPLVCEAIAESGIGKAVAVTMEEAVILRKAGVKIGHLGHLVQIPEHYVNEALAMKPDVITVVDYENALKISRHANALNVHQKLLLRVTDKGDIIYPQQNVGINLKLLPAEIDKIKKLKNVELVGFTAFPCFTLNDKEKKIIPTHNFETLRRAAHIGRDHGCEVTQVNAPGGNACDTFHISASYGATHLEPGHAFTGTTYQSASSSFGTEKIAMAYVTEISHRWNGNTYVFGGGFYGRAEINSAIVGEGTGYKIVKAYGVEPGSIDYYARLKCSDSVGTGVVYAFRTQLFMVNSSIAVVEGICSGSPRLLGVFDKGGMRLK